MAYNSKSSNSNSCKSDFFNKKCNCVSLQLNLYYLFKLNISQVPPTEPISEMQQKLRESQRVLLELKKKKLELELIATQKKIMEEEKKISLQTARVYIRIKLLY